MFLVLVLLTWGCLLSSAVGGFGGCVCFVGVCFDVGLRWVCYAAGFACCACGLGLLAWACWFGFRVDFVFVGVVADYCL